MTPANRRWVVLKQTRFITNGKPYTFWTPVWYTTAPAITTDAEAIAAYRAKHFPDPSLTLRAVLRPVIRRGTSSNKET